MSDVDDLDLFFAPPANALCDERIEAQNGGPSARVPDALSRIPSETRDVSASAAGDCHADCHASEPAAQPSAELAPPLVRDAKRQSDGTTGVGNTLALRHGLRSERYKARRRIEAGLALAAHRTQIESDHGGATDLARVRRDLIDTFTEVTLFKNDLAAKLEGGVVTGKGNTARALTAYLALVNQQVRLAAQLGMERKERRVPSVVEYWSEKAAPGGSESC